MQVKIAERAFDLQAVLADRFELRAARDEAHVVSRGRQSAAEIAADGSRRHHRDAHA